MKSTGIFACRVLAPLLLAGCAALQPARIDPPALYLLDAQPAAQASRPQRSPVLAVSTPQARPGYATPQMAYVREPHKLDYYAKNRWVDTPARMLAPLLTRTLAHSGAFRAVLQAPSSVAAELRLDTELIRLHQDFASQPSRVRLTLRAQLIDLRANQVLAEQEFDESENAPSDDANGGAIAANRAVRRALAQISAFCAEASGGH